ncbi:MAG: hypothetical protein JXA15_07750 [Spirochaetales bacterium]|nr:hypothetical protein [Spirochaetales bacterium]
MEKPSELHLAALRAGSGEPALRSALGSLARELYRDPKRYGLSGEDDVGEIFARYGARLARLVLRFEDRGVPFEAYLRSATRYFAMSLRRHGARRGDSEAVGEFDSRLDLEERANGEAKAGDSLTCAERPTVDSPETAFATERLRGALATRTGYLCLKCAPWLDDSRIARYAKRAGLSVDLLAAAVLAARACGERARARLERRVRVRDGAWARYACLERRLQREDDPTRREYLAGRLARERERFQKSLAAVRSTRTQLPNRYVASLLGVPKGTVDAGLARIKRYAPGLHENGSFPLESNP